MTANQCLPLHITLAKQALLVSLSTHAHRYEPDAEIIVPTLAQGHELHLA